MVRSTPICRRSDTLVAVRPAHPGVILEGGAEVTVRTLPIGRRRVFLVLHLHRLRCRRCGQLKQEPRDIAAPRKSYTFALARLVLDLCQQMTLSAVAQYR